MFFEFQKKIKISRSFAVLCCIVLLIGFAFGLAAVYVNCYNSMNTEPVTVANVIISFAENIIRRFRCLF